MKRVGPNILLACTPTVMVISVVAALGLVFLFPEPELRWIAVGVPIALATAMLVGFWLTYRPISVDIGRGVLWFTGADHPLADVQSANVYTWRAIEVVRTGRRVARRIIRLASTVLVIVALFMGMLALLTM